VLDNYVNTRICQKMTLAYRSELFRHSLQLPLSFHDTSRRGGLMFVVNHQSACMGEITVALLPLLQNALTVLGMLYVVFRLEPTLALLSLTVVPFVYCSTGWYGRYVEPRLRSVRGMEAESLSIVHEALSMVRVILTFGRNEHEHTRFQVQGEQAIQARVVLTVQQTLFSLVLNVITAAGTALVLWFGARQVISGSLSIGGALGAVAVATKHEVVLAIVGGLFVVETVSVIIQVFWYKRTGRRIFRMAPIHHHYEQKGWSEATVVIRFWIIAFVLALAGLSTLKLR